MPNELNSNNSLPRFRRDPTITAASFSGALPGVYRGVIVSRDDPDKQGRVKVSLPHIFGDVPVDELPWVYPITSAWQTTAGAKGGAGGAASSLLSSAPKTGGTVNVPPMGSPVVVMFEGGDHRYPMYIGGSFGKPGFTDTVPDHSFAKNGNSPDNYTFTSPGGSTLMSDERPGKEKIFAGLPTGDYVSIAKTGLTEVKAKGTVAIKAANLVSIECDTQVQCKGKQILIFAQGGDVVVEGGKTVNVNGGETVNVQAAQINLNCNTSQTALPKLKQVDTTPVFDQT